MIVFHIVLESSMRTFNRFIFCVASLVAFPQSSLATISTCVVPDEQAPVSGTCIRFADLDNWLHSSSLHNGLGDLKEDVLVQFKPGIFKLEKPITVDRGVTGNGRHKLVLAGAGAKLTVFSGAHPLRFNAVSAALRKEKNLPPNVVVASLKEAGILEVSKFSDKTFGQAILPELELFYRGSRMPIARWPNSGYARTGRVDQIDRKIVFSVKDRDVARYKTEQDLRVGGYFMHDWADEKLQVEKIDSAGRIHFAGAQPAFGAEINKRVFFENALTDIDAPGEWHVDRLSGLVYFLPPNSILGNEVVVSQVVSGLIMKRAVNVEVRDLGFEAFRGEGILLEDVDKVILRNLIVSNVGTHGVSVFGVNTLIEGVQINNTGAAGLSLVGGDRKTLQPGLLVARQCTITQVGRLQKTYTPAVSLYGVGNTVEDSVLRGGPHAAIVFHGNDHQIRRNLIEDFVQETDDAGAIYTGRDWTERGTVIEQNLIRNIGSADLHYGAHAIYLDDQASGTIVKNNLISHAGRGVFIGGGRDNTVSNNIFANCNNGVYLDARGRATSTTQGVSANQDYLDKIRAVGASSALYSSRYPGWATLLKDEPGAPKNNIVDGNIFMNCGLPSIKRLSKDGILITGSVVVNKTEKALIDGVKVNTIPKLLTVLRSKGKAPKPNEVMKVDD